MEFTPTVEQKAIIDLAATGQSVRVNAVAGSGKTATSVMVAEKMSHKAGLYLAFNKSLQIEAEPKLSGLATVRTTHGFCHRQLKIKYSGFARKLERARDKSHDYCITKVNLLRTLDIEACGNYVSKFQIAETVQNTIKKFQQSDDLEIGVKHAWSNHLKPDRIRIQIIANRKNPDNLSEKQLRKIDVQAAEISKQAREKSVLYSRMLWKLRTDENHPCKIDHDTYLKMYQLKLLRGEIAPPPVEYCILDEAQDTNECVISIVENLGTQIIAVGDARQQLYSWRGAVNAMKKFNFPSLRLSQSWRYGPETAALATKILQSDGYPFEVKGHPDIETVIGEVDRSQPYAVLCRSNMGVILEAISLFSQGVKPRIEINASRIGRLLKDFAHVKDGDPDLVYTPEVKPYADDWDMLEEISAHDLDMKRCVTMVGDDTAFAHEVADELIGYRNPRNAHVTLCTAHKSKGLEWDQVILSEDFPVKEPEVPRSIFGYSEEDINLMYVSVTRAKKRLQINSAVRGFMSLRAKPVAEMAPESEESPEDVISDEVEEQAVKEPAIDISMKEDGYCHISKKGKTSHLWNGVSTACGTIIKSKLKFTEKAEKKVCRRCIATAGEVVIDKEEYLPRFPQAALNLDLSGDEREEMFRDLVDCDGGRVLNTPKPILMG